MLEFDWDHRNRSHLARHEVTPEEAEQVIANQPFDLAREIRNGEWREAHLGETAEGRVLVVITAQEGELVRVVSAWPAKKRLRAFWRTQRKGRFHGGETESS